MNQPTSSDPSSGKTGFALVRDGNLRRLWLVGAVGEGTRWLEVLVTNIYVYEITQSALAVTLVSVVRAIPMVFLGPAAGAFAEKADPRKTLLYGTGGMALISALVALLAYTQSLTLWHLAAAGFLSGLLFSTEFPMRRRLLGEFAGPERIGAAMGFDSVTRTATRIAGPLLGGALFQYAGMHGAYLLAAATYGSVVLLLIAVPSRPLTVVAQAGTSFLSNMVDGIRFVRSNRALLGFLTVTAIMNLWTFPYHAMVPVIGHDVLQVKPFAIGILFAVEGLGAMLGALLVAIYEPRRHYQRIYIFGAALAMFAVAAFSLSDVYGLSLAIVLVGGFGMAGFTTMQATLPFLLAPPQVRSRFMGLVSVCIGIGPIGQLHLGFLADWLGAPTATTLIAIEGLIGLTLAVTFLVGKGLWRR